MFAQFRALYPAGQLICELLTIHNGKFVVRCLVQVDGKTLATGMSAAESVEDAEDRARSRSIAVLGFSDKAEAAVPVSGSPPPPPPLPSVAAVPPPPVPQSLAPLPVLEMPVTETEDTPHQSNFVNTESKINEEPVAPVAEPERPTVDRAEAAGFVQKQIDSDAWLSSSYGEPMEELEVPNTSQSELSQGAAEIRELEPISVGIPSDAIEDDSDTIANIDGILKRQGWNKKTETDCLQQLYDKSSQRELSSEQLADFLEYLEIYSRTTEEIKRLSWTASQGKDYLKQAYEKAARHLLNPEQLLDFLQYLESLP
ncbi:hypothetical protein IQ270_26255 [Microcoleus sp. LEGE 07076]|uniref:hypothetical protein n=1 Tax=Microcoleus sp. LEGE 07076 TaxID=915322 RepID=UPI00187EAB87|nr:hypothetical protein [Microcoleus sp. LEGE 07076]MBE9188049.1 hypothetical protein [Microcoleus sp. LEGE 07076]